MLRHTIIKNFKHAVIIAACFVFTLNAQEIQDLSSIAKKDTDPEKRERAFKALYQKAMDAYNDQSVIGAQLSDASSTLTLPHETKLCTAILVANVLPDMPAAKAGMKSSDQIIAVNDLRIPADHAQPREFITETIRAVKSGTVVRVSIFREGKVITIPITTANMLDARKAQDKQAMNGVNSQMLAQILAKERDIYFKKWLKKNTNTEK